MNRGGHNSAYNTKIGLLISLTFIFIMHFEFA